jgi:phospholipase/carboxylesterase
MSANLPLKYLVREPRTGAGTNAPGLVLLHGVRSNEADLMGLAPAFDGRFRVISVRAPLTLGPHAYGWYPVQFLPNGFLIDEDEARRSLDVLLQFLRELPNAVDIDAERLVVGGFSQGSVMSLAAALSEPELFAGVLCMSGRLLPSVPGTRRASAERLRGLPVMVVHGTSDNVIPFHMGRETADYLRALPVDLTWREYDMGHYVTEQSIGDIGRWLTARLDAEDDWRIRSE